MGTLRKLMIGLVILGSLAGVAGSGTFASFNASTTNAGTFDTAFLQLTADKDAAGTAICYSTNSGSGNGSATGNFANNNNTTCADTMYAAGLLNKPSTTDYSFKVKLTNSGDIVANAVKFWFSTPCATTNDAAVGNVHGPLATDLCAGLKLTIIETGASPSWTENVACRYGTASGTTCDMVASTTTLATASTAAGTVANAVSLTGTLASGASRYFIVRVRFPDTGVSGAENNYMGKQANWAISWLLEQ
jgi:hypothetical protein